MHVVITTYSINQNQNRITILVKLSNIKHKGNTSGSSETKTCTQTDRQTSVCFPCEHLTMKAQKPTDPNLKILCTKRQ